MGTGTGIGRVRGLGSAKHGAHHWLAQRYTAVGNLLLVLWLLLATAFGVPLVLGEGPWRLKLLENRSQLELSIGISLGAALVVSLSLVGVLMLVARSRCRRLWQRLGGHTADARRARQY